MADTTDLKSVGELNLCAGSSPASGSKLLDSFWTLWCFERILKAPQICCNSLTRLQIDQNEVKWLQET